MTPIYIVFEETVFANFNCERHIVDIWTTPELANKHIAQLEARAIELGDPGVSYFKSLYHVKHESDINLCR